MLVQALAQGSESSGQGSPEKELSLQAKANE